MFPKAQETVNLPSVAESTIELPPHESRPAWLLQQGGGLSWLTRLAFRCLPPRCYVCGRAGDLACVDLCRACLAALPWVAPASLPRRLACGALAFSAVDYRTPVAEALKALKFNGDRPAGRLCGALLALQMAAVAAAGITRLPDVLLPVPLHRTRHVERGFNQSLLLAREAGRWLERPVRGDALLRIKATRPQTLLTASERHGNVATAFCVLPQLAGELRRRKLRGVAIIDDVLTTGATLDAVAGALQEAGVRDVQCWSVARAIPTNTASPT